MFRGTYKKAVYLWPAHHCQTEAQFSLHAPRELVTELSFLLSELERFQERLWLLLGSWCCAAFQLEGERKIEAHSTWKKIKYCALQNNFKFNFGRKIESGNKWVNWFTFRVAWQPYLCAKHNNIYQFSPNRQVMGRCATSNCTVFTRKCFINEILQVIVS